MVMVMEVISSEMMIMVLVVVMMVYAISLVMAMM